MLVAAYVFIVGVLDLNRIHPIGVRIKQYEADQEYIDKVLANGAAQASELAAVTMKDVKEVMGLARS